MNEFEVNRLGSEEAAVTDGISRNVSESKILQGKIV
jgi:hypothetical protein